MSPSSGTNNGKFVVAAPARWDGDNNARALVNHALLRFMALGTRNGVQGVPEELTRLNPKIGLATYAAARTMSVFKAESFRFRLHPWFDRWVRKQLVEGDHIISSYGFANESFKWVRRHGGKTFLSAGNSHPENFWKLLEDEHKRWKCPDPPIARHQYERGLAMMEDVDLVLTPSSFVTRSFLERGFKPEQMMKTFYPVDLSCFKPPAQPREKERPLTIISTGALSLRKGCPYLLEAFRLIWQKHPSARFRLTRQVQDSAEPILAKYGDLPIDWAPGLPHPQLAERLQSSDIFVLASLEEGMARTALEAMACGLPVVLTPNTGTADHVQPGVNGEVVPIRDARAIADAVLKWAEMVMSDKQKPAVTFDADAMSFAAFEKDFIGQLKARGLA